MTTTNFAADLQRMAALAEQHAFSVRQLLGQRERLFEMLAALWESVGAFANGTRVWRKLAQPFVLTKSQFMRGHLRPAVKSGEAQRLLFRRVRGLRWRRDQ